MPRNAGSRPSRAPRPRPSGAFRIDDALKEFIESGVAVLVASGDAQRRPHVTYGWGPRVRRNRTSIDVFVDTARAGQTLGNVRRNGRIAVTFADPVSVRSVQLKGTFIETGDMTAEDATWVQQHREAFVVSTSLIGDPPEIIHGLWMDDVVRVSVAVESAFDQTPGPAAGKPL